MFYVYNAHTATLKTGMYKQHKALYWIYVGNKHKIEEKLSFFSPLFSNISLTFILMFFSISMSRSINSNLMQAGSIEHAHFRWEVLHFWTNYDNPIRV